MNTASMCDCRGRRMPRRGKYGRFVPDAALLRWDGEWRMPFVEPESEEPTRLELIGRKVKKFLS